MSPQPGSAVAPNWGDHGRARRTWCFFGDKVAVSGSNTGALSWSSQHRADNATTHVQVRICRVLSPLAVCHRRDNGVVSYPHCNPMMSVPDGSAAVCSPVPASFIELIEAGRHSPGHPRRTLPEISSSSLTSSRSIKLAAWRVKLTFLVRPLRSTPTCPAVPSPSLGTIPHLRRPLCALHIATAPMSVLA